MKSVSISFFLLIAFFSACVEAAPVNARYVKFEGYYTSNTSTSNHIGLYEIEVYSGGINAAKTSTVTANSIYVSNVSYLKDGNTAGNIFWTNRTSPGPASEAAPHWIQMDLGSVKSVDRIITYLYPSYKTSFGIFLSSDGTNWTRYGSYEQVSDLVQTDPLAPRVSIESAAMRPGTTLMDVVYRVQDHDDTTVKTRALAFVDGVRSFANVLKPVTFVEGTAAKLGDAIAVNQSHTLTWDVATDWQIDLGQVKFEVLAMDGRGLLPLDWIAIPAAGGHPQTTVSKNSPTNAEVLNALFWQYADGDTGLSLANGILSGNASSGAFSQVTLANGITLQVYSAPFVFKRMNLDPDDGMVATAARAGLSTPQGWHAANRSYAGVPIVSAWGDNESNKVTIPNSLTAIITAISANNNYNLALKSDGTVVGWGDNRNGQTPIPAGLNGVTAIAAGAGHSLALKTDDTVVGWGYNGNGQTTIPVGLNGVTAIAAGSGHSLALKADGTVVGWGTFHDGSTNVPMITPVGLSGVTAIASGSRHSLALKTDGTVVGWGYNGSGQTTIPAGLNGVTAIVAGHDHSLALKTDGTVVGWGSNSNGQTTIAAGLGGVSAIAAGSYHSLALKSDGTVVAWGSNMKFSTTVGQATVPAGLSGVTAIAAGHAHSLVLKAKAP
jgi:hypothetical protein